MCARKPAIKQANDFVLARRCRETARLPGAWISGITRAQHAGGPGFKVQPPVCPRISAQDGRLPTALALASGETVWLSCIRRWLKAPVRKGVGSNPTAHTLNGCQPDPCDATLRAAIEKQLRVLRQAAEARLRALPA